MDARDIGRHAAYLDRSWGSVSALVSTSPPERYGASVVLFGWPPGPRRIRPRPDAHPAGVDHDVTLASEMFDPTIARGTGGVLRLCTVP